MITCSGRKGEIFIDFRLARVNTYVIVSSVSSYPKRREDYPTRTLREINSIYIKNITNALTPNIFTKTNWRNFLFLSCKKFLIYSISSSNPQLMFQRKQSFDSSSTSNPFFSQRKKKKWSVKRLFRTVFNLPVFDSRHPTWSLTRVHLLREGEEREREKEKICATKRGRGGRRRRERARKLRSWRGGFVHKRKSIRQRGWTTGEWRSATLGAFRGRGSGDRKGGPYETFQWELHHNGLVVYIY